MGLRKPKANKKMSELEKIRGRILSVTMDLIHNEGFLDYDSYSRKLTDAYVQLIRSFGTDLEFSIFYNKCQKIRTNFFRLNRVKKRDFLSDLFTQLSNEDLEGLGLFERFDIAIEFISKYIEIGYRVDKFKTDRKILIDKMMNIREPHERIMACFNEFLQKIANSYQIDLHGTKEYSGIDICKKYKGAMIGFQIKSKNDDISEDMIRSESSKAQEWKFKGFVLIYARKTNRKVNASIQAAFHHFKRLIDSRTMYCSIVHPELLAELFRKYSISIEL